MVVSILVICCIVLFANLLVLQRLNEVLNEIQDLRSEVLSKLEQTQLPIPEDKSNKRTMFSE